ncbi:DNA-binding NarL/FixJ family response regulator [Streptomyces phaeochromogenes]|nr:DNA-binding NarL/FixJ family response regulator [Streptomyces phaeochromogenes]
MCRMAAWVTNRPTTPVDALGREVAYLATVHDDGWGAAWVDPSGAHHTHRSGLPAHTDPDFEAFVAGTETRACFVHIRLGTPGYGTGISNVHPFARESWAFAHNGALLPTTYGMDEYVFEALRAGAAGFLVKDIVPEDLLHAVRVAARGDALLAPSITRKLIHRYVAQPPPASTAALEELTSREREAVALAARGLSNDQIADHMVISPMTAKTHINRAMTKLHTRDRAQLVVLAYESGLVAPRNR